jgi:protocatechuate 3,4-dioxygenase alpha subunit
MPATSSQTIGPFWHLIEDRGWADLTRFGAGGERILLRGRITDGAGQPVARACVELWQPSPPASESWDGFGRCNTDPDGEFCFTTLKPGAVPGPPGSNVAQAPHAAITILASGLMTHLHSRIYFDGEEANARDPLLASLPPGRRATLIARPDGHEKAMPAWRLDIRLQGAAETVFLQI